MNKIKQLKKKNPGIARHTNLQPENKFQSLNDLALQFYTEGDYQTAQQLYARHLAMVPGDIGAWCNLGVLMRKEKQPETAVICYKRALNLTPDDASLWSNLGNALRDLDRLDESKQALERGISCKFDSPGLYFHLGLTERDLGNTDTAIKHFLKAEQLGYKNKDELHWELGFARLLAGDLKNGFSDYEHRWGMEEAGRKRHERIPEWDGRSLKHSLLVCSEQGFGDTIQFCRFLPLLKSLVQQVVFEVQPELVRLLKVSPACEGIEIVARGESIPPVSARASLMSLPFLLGTDWETLPTRTPYLRPPSTHPAPFSESSDRLRIGIAWNGSPSFKNNAKRSMSLSQFAPILEMPELTYYSFLKGSAEEEIKQFGMETVVHNLSGSIRDFADSAAIMSEMDLVITTCTSVAHLAGALGKPVWVLLCHAADWRWLLKRQDTPWYPTMKLFRQQTPGDWDGVIRSVTTALDEWLANKENSSPVKMVAAV